MTSGDGRREARETIVHALVIVATTVLVFAGSVDGAFVSDDVMLVQNNPLLRSLSPAGIAAIFRSFDGPNYVPVAVTSLALDDQAFGPGPFGHHVTNVLLHAACALLVYAILRRLWMTPFAAFLTAMLWAIHPLQVESVAWIAERRNVLSGLFFFAAFLAYLAFSDRPRASTYVAFLVCYVLALLSKMNTMVLPAVCVAYEVAFRHRLRPRDLLAALPPLVLAALVGWYNIVGNPIHGDAWYGGSRTITWLSVSVVPFRYLGNVLLPWGLRPTYDVRLYDSPFVAPVPFALAGLAGLAIGTIALLVRRRREAFWVLWFVITLLPMLNVLVPFRSLMNDRYMYLSLVGPLALAASVLAAYEPAPLRRAGAVIAMAAAVAYAGVSIRQVGIWASPLTLWAANADRPMLGVDPVYRAPDHAERVAYLQRALAEHPSSGALHNNLGALYYGAGELPEAVAELEEARRLLPDDPAVLLNLGRAYALLGRPDAAGPALARAVDLRPYDFLSRYQLLRFQLYVEHDPAEARATLDAALRLRSDERTLRSLGPEMDGLARLEAENGGAR